MKLILISYPDNLNFGTVGDLIGKRDHRGMVIRVGDLVQFTYMGKECQAVVMLDWFGKKPIVQGYASLSEEIFQQAGLKVIPNVENIKEGAFVTKNVQALLRQRTPKYRIDSLPIDPPVVTPLYEENLEYLLSERMYSFSLQGTEYGRELYASDDPKVVDALSRKLLNYFALDSNLIEQVKLLKNCYIEYNEFFYHGFPIEGLILDPPENMKGSLILISKQCFKNLYKKSAFQFRGKLHKQVMEIIDFQGMSER